MSLYTPSESRYPAPMVALLAVNLAVAVVESLFYGAYIVLALFLVMLTYDSELSISNPPRLRRAPILFGSSALFGTVTAHWILNIVRLFLAFHDSDQGPRPNIFYSDLSHRTEVLKYGFLVASLLIGDLLMIHRLWVIWARYTRIIVFPLITLLGLVAFGGGLTYQLSTYTASDSIFESTFRRWQTGVCFFSFSTAMYTTGFIWYKLWTTSRALASFGISNLCPIMRIFIDSAAIFAIWGSFHVLTYQCGSNLQSIAMDCAPTVVGVSSVLIQIRIHWDLNESRSSGALVSTRPIRFATEAEESRRERNREVGMKPTQNNFPLQDS
ncbi:hypothetical protein C8R43DRAFT_1021439 [Mycena crocata]|nr:hypothetical protein C8R43DRAFT_1021439 [Mycena crocata]